MSSTSSRGKDNKLVPEAGLAAAQTGTGSHKPAGTITGWTKQ